MPVVLSLGRLKQEDLELETSWDVPNKILPLANDNRLCCINAICGVFALITIIGTTMLVCVLGSCAEDIFEVELVKGRKCMVDSVIFMATLSFKGLSQRNSR